MRDRGELRDMLINSLPENAIQWDHKATSIDAFETNQYEVKFANGRAFRADVLIGADGAWSKVRPLMTTAKPEYSDTCFNEIAYPADGREAERLAVAIGTGTLVTTAPGKGIIAHRNADSSISGYVALNKPESWIRSIDFSHAQNSRELVYAQFKGRSEQLVDFITMSTLAKPTIRPIFALPVGHDWSRKVGITLIGDATHLMSPFAGEGANLAMYDGADLAGAIIANPNDLEQAILTYELALFERTLDVARMSAENLRLFFGETAPHSVVDLFSGLFSPET
ncbi:FAD-dependent oxidoreductase [Pseudochrobactrum asaccharolyticum]|uniref:FAD-dependent oxidoreductase n=1 Tax=Pseudochrobactrum asaccharolyticum TaxID=354351 RepID=UPI0040431688